jgi:hypothetical protein
MKARMRHVIFAALFGRKPVKGFTVITVPDITLRVRTARKEGRIASYAVFL